MERRRKGREESLRKFYYCQCYVLFWGIIDFVIIFRKVNRDTFLIIVMFVAVVIIFVVVDFFVIVVVIIIIISITIIWFITHSSLKL